MSKKRSLDPIDCQSNTNEPPLKRQKLAPNHHHKSSSFFTHKLDKEQYQEIFNAIDNSQMIKSLFITHSISRNIAEFANGQLRKCANDKCNNDISTLHQDSIIYGNNHDNSVKVGYKWCPQSDKLLCSDCMHLATPCNCDECDKLELNYNERRCLIFSLNKCDLCMEPMTFSGTDCVRCPCICSKCNGKYCGECNMLRYCVRCEDFFCDKCYTAPEEWDNEYMVLCHGCYDCTMIECEKCNAKYKLLFKGNHYLWNTDLDCRMLKCKNQNCDVFICFNCDTKQRNGKQYFCEEFGCESCIHQACFCNQHAPKQAFCSSIQLYELC